MCPVQTEYSRDHGAAYEGQKATVVGLFNTRTGIAEGSNVPAGRGVFAGTSDNQVVVPSGGETIDAFRGISLYEVDHVLDVAQNEPENQNRPITLVTTGDIWVYTEDGATTTGATSDVYLIINAAGGGTPGRFRSTADGANTIQIPNAKFITTAAAGELAKVSLDLG